MIAPRDFSLATGELTPTMKLKRHTVLEMYAKKIDQVKNLELFFNWRVRIPFRDTSPHDNLSRNSLPPTRY
jgi:hypothetical protein